jgi:hypothetical protein
MIVYYGRRMIKDGTRPDERLEGGALFNVV